MEMQLLIVGINNLICRLELAYLKIQGSMGACAMYPQYYTCVVIEKIKKYYNVSAKEM